MTRCTCTFKAVSYLQTFKLVSPPRHQLLLYGQPHRLDGHIHPQHSGSELLLGVKGLRGVEGGGGKVVETHCSLKTTKEIHQQTIGSNLYM